MTLQTLPSQMGEVMVRREMQRLLRFHLQKDQNSYERIWWDAGSRSGLFQHSLNLKSTTYFKTLQSHSDAYSLVSLLEMDDHCHFSLLVRTLHSRDPPAKYSIWHSGDTTTSNSMHTSLQYQQQHCHWPLYKIIKTEALLWNLHAVVHNDVSVNYVMCCVWNHCWHCCLFLLLMGRHQMGRHTHQKSCECDKWNCNNAVTGGCPASCVLALWVVKG